MTVAAGKQKGRKFQQYVCAELLKVGEPYGLQKDDIRSCPMGSQGEDCQLSPLARKVLGDIAVEVKCRESLVVPTIFLEHEAKYPTKTAWLVHRRNHTPALVTVRLETLLSLLKSHIMKEQNVTNSN